MRKKEPATEHWQDLVKVWFDFWNYNFSEPPTFQGPQSKSLKLIVENLKKRTEAKGFEWTKNHACSILLQFFQMAFNRAKEKNRTFLLPTINFYFDDIITAYKSKQQQRNNDIQGAFDQINRSFGSKGDC